MKETNDIKQNWKGQKQIGIFFSKKSGQNFLLRKKQEEGSSVLLVVNKTCTKLLLSSLDIMYNIFWSDDYTSSVLASDFQKKISKSSFAVKLQAEGLTEYWRL